MPHVELSLSDDSGPEEHTWGQPSVPPHASLRRWSEVVSEAVEPCVVLDADGVVVASSPACQALLGGYDSTADVAASGDGWLGRGLLDVLRLVDLTATGEPLAAWESERIPPLLALATGRLARGVMRFRIGEATRTVDAVSTPLRDGSTAIGSLTFLHRL